MKRIIEKGGKPGTPIYQHTCLSCDCKFEFTVDEVTYEWSDPHDGSRYWVVPCPACGYKVMSFRAPEPVRYDEEIYQDESIIPIGTKVRIVNTLSPFDGATGTIVRLMGDSLAIKIQEDIILFPVSCVTHCYDK